MSYSDIFQHDVWGIRCKNPIYVNGSCVSNSSYSTVQIYPLVSLMVQRTSTEGEKSDLFDDLSIIMATTENCKADFNLSRNSQLDHMLFFSCQMSSFINFSLRKWHSKKKIKGGIALLFFFFLKSRKSDCKTQDEVTFFRNGSTLCPVSFATTAQSEVLKPAVQFVKKVLHIYNISKIRDH